MWGMDLDLDRAAERLRVAFDLYQLGEDLMRQQLRRRHPGASAAELEDMLVKWLHTRPGAEHGDCPGRLRGRPSESVS